MSQAIQHNSQVMMTRHPKFLRTAEALRPALSRQAHPPIAVVEAHADAAALFGWRAEPVSTLAAFYQRELSSGDSVIIDFGSHYVGYLHFLCQSAGSPPDAPAHLQLTFGETLSEVCEPFSDYQGWLSSSWLQQQDLWLDVLPAEIDLPRRYCFRYLKVEVKAVSRKFRLQFTQVEVNAVTSASGACPAATTSDPQLRAIDNVAVLTLQNCMQEVFEDGPKRDRRLWLGDLRLQALVNDVTFARHALAPLPVPFAGHTREDGMVSANVFVQPDVIADDTFLFDYSLFFVDVLYNYLQSAEDMATARELWPTARRQVELALTRCDASGVVRDSDDWWVFIDWQASLNKQAAAQGVLIYCLQRAIWLAERFEPEQAASYRQRLQQLKAAALDALWDPQQGFYVSGARRQVSGHRKSGWCWRKSARRSSAGRSCATWRKIPAVAMNTPYLRHHYIAALLQCGLREEAIAEIKAYWGAMINYGADTFWEIFDPADPEFSPYGSKLINSYCHAWSCTPAWFIRQYGL
ncbi:MAG: sugar hydrolase [Enterobacteriaceae bacterium]